MLRYSVFVLLAGIGLCLGAVLPNPNLQDALTLVNEQPNQPLNRQQRNIGFGFGGFGGHDHHHHHHGGHYGDYGFGHHHGGYGDFYGHHHHHHSPYGGYHHHHDHGYGHGGGYPGFGIYFG